MAVSATFNIGGSSPYVEDSFEDHSDLMSNPFEEGEVNPGHGTQGGSYDPNQCQGTSQSQGDQGNKILPSQIQALFSCFIPEFGTVLDDMILGVSKTSYRQFLLCWIR